MEHIRHLVISNKEPKDIYVGWLKPEPNGKYLLYFYNRGEWVNLLEHLESKQVINHLNKTFTLAGVVSPESVPENSIFPVFYIAKQAGIYSYFDGIEIKNPSILYKVNNTWESIEISKGSSLDISDILDNSISGSKIKDNTIVENKLSLELREKINDKPIIPTVNNATITIQKNGETVDSFTSNQASAKTINITVPTTAAEVSALPASTKYGYYFDLSINSETYVVSLIMKDQNGNAIGETQTIDLPLESVVVNGSYDKDKQKIVLTLESGSTIDVPVVDLIAGLQTEITSTNKLSADLITNGTINKTVTEGEKNTWNNKQDSIPDIDTIRSNASAGKNASDTIETFGDIVTHNISEINDALAKKQNTISDLEIIRSGASKGNTSVQPNDLATVATSGDYNDLTNKPTIPSIDGLATETYVNNTVANLVDSAPEALNTLNKLATALGNDENFATTISNQIPTKVSELQNDSGFSILPEYTSSDNDKVLTIVSGILKWASVASSSGGGLTNSEVQQLIQNYAAPIRHTHSQDDIGSYADITYNIIPNIYIDNRNGNEISYSGWNSTDYIDLGNTTSMKITYLGTQTPYNAFYDENKVFVSPLSLQPGVTIFDKPSNIRYIRISNSASQITKDTLTISLGTSLNNILENKQDKLVNGTNIKTINGESILGNGNIVIVTIRENSISLTELNDKILPYSKGETVLLQPFNAARLRTKLYRTFREYKSGGEVYDDFSKLYIEIKTENKTLNPYPNTITANLLRYIKKRRLSARMFENNSSYRTDRINSTAYNNWVKPKLKNTGTSDKNVTTVNTIVMNKNICNGSTFYEIDTEVLKQFIMQYLKEEERDIPTYIIQVEMLSERRFDITPYIESITYSGQSSQGNISYKSKYNPSKIRIETNTQGSTITSIDFNYNKDSSYGNTKWDLKISDCNIYIKEDEGLGTNWVQQSSINTCTISLNENIPTAFQNFVEANSSNSKVLQFSLEGYSANKTESNYNISNLIGYCNQKQLVQLGFPMFKWGKTPIKPILKNGVFMYEFTIGIQHNIFGLVPIKALLYYNEKTNQMCFRFKNSSKYSTCSIYPY